MQGVRQSWLVDTLKRLINQYLLEVTLNEDQSRELKCQNLNCFVNSKTPPPPSPNEISKNEAENFMDQMKYI